MKAFVTGATGFLGSHLVDLLLQEGHDVTCLVRKTSDLRWLRHKKVRLVNGDLFPDHPGLLEGLKDADWCFHAAGVISAAQKEDYYRVNAGGTRHCLEACLKAAPRLKRFVLVSSIASCGPSLNGEILNEKTADHPVTLYGQSKLEAEKILWSYADRIPSIVLRPCAIYGPRDAMILPVFKMAKRRYFFVPAGPPRSIAMVHVEDVARACVWGAKAEKGIGETFFVTDGDIYFWQDVADALSHIYHHKIYKIPVPKTLLWPIALAEELRGKGMGQRPRLHRGYVRQFYLQWKINADKIKRAGFLPKYNLESGMKQTVAGYRQLGWL